MLEYKALRQSGEVIVDTLLEMQFPYKNSDKGIIVITNEPSKRKPTSVTVAAGHEENGRPILVEVQEIEPTESEVKEAHRRAEVYKKEVINEYLQSKRERVSGGAGRTTPAGLTKVFMDEYGVSDIDAVSKSLEKAVAANPGMTPEMFITAMKMVLDAQKPAEPVVVGPPGAKPKPVASPV